RDWSSDVCSSDLRPRIRDGAHDLLADDFRGIAKIDAASFSVGLPHFTVAIQARNLNELIPVRESKSFFKIAYLAKSIKAVSKRAGQLPMVLLVFTDGHFCAMMTQHITGHQNRPGQQSCINVVRISPYFVFERCSTLQLAEVGIHVHI